MNDKKLERRITLSCAAGIIGVVLLTGCVATASTGAAPGESPEASAKFVPQTAEELAPEAIKEGEVLWYTVNTDDNSKLLIDEFNKEYPDIKISPLRIPGGGAQMSSRVMTEQLGNEFRADIITGSASSLVQLRVAGALQPYDPPETTELDGLELPEGFRGVAFANTTVIAYDPSAVKEAGLVPPTGWEDLTDPAWKGRFSINPESADWYQCLIESMGHDEALKLVKALGDNEPRLTSNATQELVDLQAGATLAAGTAFGPKANQYAEKDPERIAFVNSNPVPTILMLTSLAKNAPHPSAAKLFQGWLLSKAGQAVTVDALGKISVRDDVENHAKVWDPSKWEPVIADLSKSPEDQNADAAELRSALHAD